VGSLHGVRRLRGGRVRVRLSGRERQLLRSLPAQLRPILSGEQSSPELRERLFPPAYDDPEAEREYRALIGDTLAEERLAALETFARTLESGEGGTLLWTVELSPEDTAAWLSAINDARLTLGALLGISDERQWEAGPDRRNPTSLALYYLGWLEEELVEALMSELPDSPDR
jgi:hypothetical protein